jgi:2-dehydro-3-deoxyphosphogluconate aldolase/(4S)-4-hydroxy-2-oxoglutarate aldolase
MSDTQRRSICKEIERAGVVAIIRTSDPSTVTGTAQALMDGGVRALEITMSVPGAVELIWSLAKTIPPGFLLGACTVTDAETAARVIDAGARFIVSPVFRPAVVQAAHAGGVPAMPGCFSPTEILEAWDAGADIVKVFPATALGPGYLKDVHGPLPHVKLMPTGGVTIDNAGDWIRAGAVAVGIGSALLDRAAVAAGDFVTIAADARRLVANVARAREARP